MVEIYLQHYPMCVSHIFKMLNISQISCAHRRQSFGQHPRGSRPHHPAHVGRLPPSTPHDHPRGGPGILPPVGAQRSGQWDGRVHLHGVQGAQDPGMSIG